MLATSRAPLRLRAEREFPVPPLDLPASGRPLSPAEAARFGAVRLFAGRARAVQPGFTLDGGNSAAVAALCRRLDGLPLAIELAAASVRALAPPAMLARLERRLPLPGEGPRDMPARQRTLRATLEWSYGLLEPGERALFARLAVFADGWTPEAAEAVGAGGAIDEAAVLDLLGRLAEQWLVTADGGGEDGEPRYRMLETVRAYAGERLAASGEGGEARRRHAAAYLALAEEAERACTAPRRGAGWRGWSASTPICAPPWAGTSPRARRRGSPPSA